MIRLWGRANSFNVQKAMWVLGEAGVEYERLDLGGGFGGLREAEYLAKNPNGYIPTIDDGGFCLWESHSIVRYIAEKYAPGQLCPADIEGRAIASQWMDWALCNLGPSFMELFWGLVR
ncbi:MAG: glutathione S-transferase N-terminal domain-containing protein, partial [Chloroflexi bacterium]|nr:glutathione S-transferase N-terminal domain-containing protein [Chloroflexota bacterium]